MMHWRSRKLRSARADMLWASSRRSNWTFRHCIGCGNVGDGSYRHHQPGTRPVARTRSGFWFGPDAFRSFPARTVDRPGDPAQFGLPALFATLAAEYEAVDARIEEIDAELTAFAKSNPACRALLSVPGVGVIVATALLSAVANISDFRSGRDLAAFLGLVPRQRSTGGKTTLLEYRNAVIPMSER